MINKDDLDVGILRILDQLDRLDSKIDKLMEADKHHDKKMFDAFEVKRMLNISDSTLWRYCKRGLKYYRGKQGRKLFAYDDLMEFIRGKL